MATDYKKRLQIPLTGDTGTIFYTKSGTKVATGYERVVIGQRGPYIEFTTAQIHLDNFHIPESALYRLIDRRVYYVEYRSADDCNVKLYQQRRLVEYADYRIGYCYISPFDLKTDVLDELVSQIP